MNSSLEKYISQNDLTIFCKKNYIKKLALFGSAVRNELRPDSDIDILVEFEKDHVPGLLRFSHMKNELSDTIGRDVDLRTPEDLNRNFRNNVVQEAMVAYES